MQKRPKRQRCRAFRVSLAYYFTINPSINFLYQNKDKINITFPLNEALNDTLPSRVDDPKFD
jgi:hypothetical protein